MELINMVTKNNAEKSIAKNTVYYFIYQMLNVLFPFVSGMYIARVLLPNSVGIVAYAQNIVQYFVVLAFLGIPTYGIREIAKVRRDRALLSKLYSELMVINFISTFVFSAMYFLMIFTVTYFREYLYLYIITGSTIVINVLNNTWLYEGLENFKYVSIRNIVFKIGCFIAIIVFVKKPSDYLIYVLIYVLGTMGNYVVNMIYSIKFVDFSLENINFSRHLKSIFVLVCINIAIELYTLVDVTMLGVLAGAEHVAYYSYASKINKIFLTLLNSIIIVTVPRLSILYSENNKKSFNGLLSQTLNLIVLFSVPAVIGIFTISDYAVVLLYGRAFMKSAGVLRALSFVLIVSPIGYLLGSRVLLVTNNEKKIVLCVCLGAIVNLVLNFILIPIYYENGAALASVISEIIVMISYILCARTYFRVSYKYRNLLKIILASVVMAVTLLVLAEIIHSDLVKIIVSVLTGIFVYFGCLIVLKESCVASVIGKIDSAIIHR